jgi:alcohol dehydrogenase
MVPFDFQPVTRLVFGSDKIELLGKFIQEFHVKRVLVVSDPGVVAAGHTAHGIAAIEAEGLRVATFTDVRENPTTEDVDRGLKVARGCESQLIVGLGGGSAMDCAKGINFLLTNGGQMKDYWGVGKARHPMLPMIAVPTTAGTGSESQSFALISDSETKAKMACGDKKAACRVAVLDPKLTVTQPPRVTALTGIDAIAHALETFVTQRRNPVSLAFSREAWRLLSANFGRVLDDAEDLEARSGMQLGASFAGAAIENSMLGAAHALANPLTARFGIVHGEAVGMMLPHVVRFNGETFPQWYGELLHVSADVASCPDVGEGPAGLADFVGDLAARAGLATSLRQCGVQEAALEDLAEAAATQWTGTFNPRQVGPAELLRIYQQAL